MFDPNKLRVKMCWTSRYSFATVKFIHEYNRTEVGT